MSALPGAVPAVGDPVDALDRDQVTVDDVQDAVRADAQPVVPAAVKAGSGPRVLRQGLATGDHWMVTRRAARGPRPRERGRRARLPRATHRGPPGAPRSRPPRSAPAT